MTSHWYAALGLVLVSATGALAQDGKKVAIDDLSAPQSPAFVLLGVAPASVERPETPKAVGLNFLDQLSTANGLPRNYALEIAPYWLRAHPSLTFEAYQNPGITQSILQTLLVSVATAPIPGASASDDPRGSRVAFGTRVALFNGRADQRFQAAVRSLVGELEAVDDEVFDLMEEEDKWTATLRAHADDALAATNLALVRQQIAAARAKTEPLALSIQQLDAERVGFFVNVAAATSWNAPNDDIREAGQGKRGFWVTPSYRWRACGGSSACESSIDAIAVLRTLKEPLNSAALDYGGRVVWKANKTLNLSLEALRRRQDGLLDESNDSNRTVGMVEYRIREDLTFFGSFGQDFQALTGEKPLVSLFGLNMGFGKKAEVLATSAEP